MAIAGVRATDDWVTDQRPKSFLESLMLLFPNGDLPLTAMLDKLRKSKVDDPEFAWYSKTMMDYRLELGANLDATAGTDTVTVLAESGVRNGARSLKAGDILYVEQTGELLRVANTPTSDTSVDCVRGFAGTTVTAVTFNGAGVNPKLLMVGSALPENSSAPPSVSFQATKYFNYTQIFRDTLALSRTAQKTRLRTGPQVAESKRETLQLHGIGIERALWFGVRSEDLSGSEPRRSTGGIIKFIADNAAGNVIDWQTYNSGAKDYTTLLMILELAFRYGATEKMGFCGNQALVTLDKLVRLNSDLKIIMTGEQKEFGMNVRRLICPFGTLVLKTHPLFNRQTGGTTGGSAYYGRDASIVICDMDNFRWRYIDGANMVYQPKLEANDLDGMMSGFLTEGGLEIYNPETFVDIQKFVGAAAG
jgi:hypothetical protein